MESIGQPYYVHAGLALHIRNFSSELDDIDIKVFHQDLSEIYKAAKNFFDCEVRLVEGGTGSFGQYMFPRIEIDEVTPIDICTRTGVINDLGHIAFPFSLENFKQVEVLSYKGVKVPVSSVENLLLYYLSLRRGPTEGKNDEQKIKEILQSGSFNKGRFLILIKECQNSEGIIKLYEKYVSNIA